MGQDKEAAKKIQDYYHLSLNYSVGLKSFHHCLGVQLLMTKHENTYVNHYI